MILISNFEVSGLVFSCIETKFFKKILVGISYLFEKKIEKRDMGRDSLESSLRDLQDLHAFADLNISAKFRETFSHFVQN